jgi:hypothetical protein
MVGSATLRASAKQDEGACNRSLAPGAGQAGRPSSDPRLKHAGAGSSGTFSPHGREKENLFSSAGKGEMLRGAFTHLDGYGTRLFCTSDSTTDGSARVEVSPSWSGAFSAILRRMRRMILPLRVFGSPGAHCR